MTGGRWSVGGSSIDAWRSTWHGPMNRVVIPFIGRLVGSEIVLEGRHWIKADALDLFRHHGPHVLVAEHDSKDGGATREKVLEFTSRRVRS